MNQSTGKYFWKFHELKGLEESFVGKKVYHEYKNSTTIKVKTLNRVHLPLEFVQQSNVTIVL